MTPIIDREIFFGNPEIIGGKLSPNGEYLAFIKPYNGVRNLWIKRISDPFDAARPVTEDTTRPIPGYFWSHDSKYLLFVQDKGGNEDFHVFALDPFDVGEGRAVPVARNLTPLDGVRAVIARVPETAPDKIIVGLNDRDKSWHDLYEVRIADGAKTLIYENTNQISGWNFDLKDRLRLATRSTKEGGSELLIIREDGLHKCYESSFEESSYVIRAHKDGKRFFLVTNKGADTNLSKLVLFDPETGHQELVDADPEGQVDFGGALFSRLTDEIISTNYDGDKPRIYFRDEDYRSDYHKIKSRLPGVEVNFGSSTRDERKWLVYATSDTDPGATYLFDRDTKELKFQYRPRPELPVEYLTNMEAVRYTSSDGLEIPAYLSLPKGLEPKGLPAMLLIHGGPWARDSWGYDGLAQFLTNRGYVVLQPNFRGSTGYGKRFLNAANGEWGRKMQDDVTAGAEYLVRRGIADPKRIGIMGGSYGGYATLAGLTFTPDVYAVGVSIVGPSNLLTLLNSIPPYWETIREMFYKRLANPNTEAGFEQLKDQSPLFHADRIRVPLLVAQGANDPRVKQAESDQIVVAMRNLGLPVEYLVAPDEGHGFARPENNMAFIAAVERFLARHLGGRFQSDMPEPIRERLAEISVDIETVRLPGNLQEPLMEKGYPEFAADLTEGEYFYQMTIDSGQQKIPIEVERKITRDDDHWVVSDKGASLMGDIEDTIRLRRQGLLPVRQSIVQGPVQVEIEYSDHEISGTLSMDNKSHPFQVQVKGPVLGASLARSILFPLLPLENGERYVFQAFDAQTQKVESLELETLLTEEVTVMGGTFDTIKVQLKAPHGNAGTGFLWIATEGRRLLVKSEMSLPKFGGAKVYFELQAIN